MEKLMLTRKLNNKSGKSIFMALFLLLVCVVVSVVIITVATTSVMHVEDNKTSNQEYLACASAAKLIEDCVAGSEYEYEHLVGTYTYTVSRKSSGGYGSSSRYNTKDETIGESAGTDGIDTKDALVEDFGMGSFVMQVSQTIRDGGSLSKNFTVEQSDMYPVTAECKLVKKNDSEYSLRIKLFAQKDTDSHGYYMSMVIPITVENVTLDDKRELDCQISYSNYSNISSSYREIHREYGSYSSSNYAYYNLDKVPHSFTINKIKSKSIKIKWSNTMGIEITKGTSAYED